ncbi:MAG: hypothetical protein M3069_33205 [Chloroflexota bacterium]|nr:hypothetical protein [Chloroflexota bacterium]
MQTIALHRWEPFREMIALRNSADRLFECGFRAAVCMAGSAQEEAAEVVVKARPCPA